MVLISLLAARAGADPAPAAVSATRLDPAPAPAATLAAPVPAAATEPVVAAAPAPAPVTPTPVAQVAVPLGKPAPLPIALSGLIQLWETMPQAPGEVATTRFRRTEFQARGEVGEHVSWQLKMDPAQVKEDDAKSDKAVRTVVPSGTGFTATTASPYITSAGRKSVLQDAVLAYDAPFPDAPWVKRVQVGQFKFPFGMEGLMASNEVDTTERSMMSTILKWSDQRDLGGQVQLGAGSFNLWAGGFSGEGQNVSDVNNYENMNFRATWRPTGWMVVGGAWQGGRTGRKKDLNDHAGAELSCKFRGGAVPISLKGEFVHGVRGPRGKAVASRTAYGTLGIGVWPDVLEVVGKEDWLDPGVLAAADWRTETSAGVNWFIQGHQAEVQVNYVRVDEPATALARKIPNDFIRVNAEVAF